MLAAATAAHLGVDLVQTTDADHEGQLGLGFNIEATLLLGLTPQPNSVLLLQSATTLPSFMRCHQPAVMLHAGHFKTCTCFLLMFFLYSSLATTSQHVAMNGCWCYSSHSVRLLLQYALQAVQNFDHQCWQHFVGSCWQYTAPES